MGFAACAGHLLPGPICHTERITFFRPVNATGDHVFRYNIAWPGILCIWDGSFFVEACGFKRKVDDFVLRIYFSISAAGRILGQVVLKNAGATERDSNTAH